MSSIVTERWGLVAQHSKASEHAMLVERKNLLYFRCWQLRGRSDICPKANSPPQHTQTHQQTGDKKFYRQREGAACRNGTVSSDSHLEVGHVLV